MKLLWCESLLILFFLIPVLELLFYRSQAARGKEKDKEGTTESGIKLEPVPGLPGGKGGIFLSEIPDADLLPRARLVLNPREL